VSAVRVYIATTQAPSEVQRIAKEDPHVRSVVCLNGTSEALPISAAYDAFVRKPTGVIERKYGHSVYRLDVSERISDGESWQLGFFIAHALFATDTLAGKGEKADRAVWVTGEVDRDLKVNPVDHVVEKLRQSATLFAELEAAGIPLTIFIPRANAEGIKPVWGNVVALESVDEICRELGLAEGKKLAHRGWITGFAILLVVLLAGTALWPKLDPNQKVAVVVEKIQEKSGPSKLTLDLTATAHRALDRCPASSSNATVTNRVAVGKGHTGHFTNSTWERLCWVEYGFLNASTKPAHAWINLSVIDPVPFLYGKQSLPGTAYRQLAPGERIFITLVLPRWSKTSLTIQVIAALGTVIPSQTQKWLDEADTDALSRAGLTVRTAEHVVNAPTKQRFN
jgi:hypothetical protein